MAWWICVKALYGNGRNNFGETQGARQKNTWNLEHVWLFIALMYVKLMPHTWTKEGNTITRLMLGKVLCEHAVWQNLMQNNWQHSPSLRSFYRHCAVTPCQPAGLHSLSPMEFDVFSRHLWVLYRNWGIYRNKTISTVHSALISSAHLAPDQTESHRELSAPPPRDLVK